MSTQDVKTKDCDAKETLLKEMREKHWARFEMDSFLYIISDPNFDVDSCRVIFQHYAFEWTYLTTALLFCNPDVVRHTFETDYQRRPLIALELLAELATEQERRVGFPVPPLSSFFPASSK